MARQLSRWRLGLALLALLAVVPVYLCGGALLEWATTRRIFYEEHSGATLMQGLRTVERFGEGNPVEELCWYVETGFLRERTLYEGELGVRNTHWNKDGTLSSQFGFDLRQGRPYLIERSEPPWLWGESDQTRPSAPHWSDTRIVRKTRGDWVTTVGYDRRTQRKRWATKTNGKFTTIMSWNEDGTIRAQYRNTDFNGWETRVAPPWWESAERLFSAEKL